MTTQSNSSNPKQSSLNKTKNTCAQTDINFMNNSNTLQTLGEMFLEMLKHAQPFLEETKSPISSDALTDAFAYKWMPKKNGFGTVYYQLIPIKQSKNIVLTDLQGIDTQKSKIIQNTEQFLAGLPANHVLLTGSRGAGKSSLIRAILQRYAEQGLRLIEVKKTDLASLSELTEHIQNLPNHQCCKYLIYCDDLAFSEEDEDYRMLKSFLDGSISSFGDQFLIYATSNRKHLMPQYMQDNVNIYNRITDEVNPLEQIDETVSLSDRFGLWLSFHPMLQDVYLDIVANEIQKAELVFDDLVKSEALKWASARGGRSGRVAYQFSRHWIGLQGLQNL